MLRNLVRDGRYGVRALLHSRTTTIIAVLALALGIGANTVIYSVVNTVLLHPVSYPQLDQLVVLWGLQAGTAEKTLAYPAEFDAWRAQSAIFQEVAAIRQRDLTMTGLGEPTELSGEEVSSNYFSTLGIKPVAGRTFTAEEDTAGHEQIAVIGERFWRQQLNGDPGAIGKSLVLNNSPYTLIGVVADENLGKGHQSEIWIPLVLNRNFQGRYLRVIARMRPGISRKQAEARLQAPTELAQKSYPALEQGRKVQVAALNDEIVSGVRTAILTLWAAVIFVLLIACANVANILLARIMGREREIAVRRALGASRWGVVQQFLVEGMVLALLGGTLGLVAAKLGIGLLIKLGPGDIPRLSEVSIDGPVFAFAAVVSLITSIIFGLVPALRASTMEVNGLLKDGNSNATGGKGKIRLREVFVMAEVLLAMVLLVAAGLMINSVYRLQARELGFNPHNLLTLRLNLPGSQYSDTAKKTAFFRDVYARVSSQPGVLSVGLTSSLPTDRLIADTDVMALGHPMAKIDRPKAAIQVIGASYFAAMRVPLKSGRVFSEAELQNPLPRIIINDALARKLFPGENAVGKSVLINDDEGHPDEIIGVTGNVIPPDSMSSEGPVVYYPYSRLPFPSMALVVLTASRNPEGINADLARQIHSVDPNQPIAEISTMDEIISGSASRPRFNALLLAMFALSALVLSSIGIYGIVSYTVGQSTREISVRMALGASPSVVLRTMLKKGLVPVLYGIAAGLVVSVLLTRFMVSMLFNVHPYDPLTFIGVALLLGVIAFVAAFIPARRAMNVDPWNALRFE
jgi:putative ABC transport system permease protein